MGMRLYCWITGDNYAVVEQQDVKSKKKIRIYGIGIFLPTAIWLVVGYLLAKTFFDVSTLGSAIAAVFIAGMIFTIERLIIMHDGGGSTMVLRVVLGLTVSLIGSVIIDECFFKKDLDNRMLKHRESKLDEFKKDMSHDLDSIQVIALNDYNNSMNDWRSALAEASAEADGSNGSGNSGVGKITQLKMNIAREKKERVNEAEQKLIAMGSEKQYFSGLAEEKFKEQFDENALITRIEVMWLLFEESNVFKVIWTCFTLFVMILEFFIIILKMNKKKTLYELKLQYEQELGEKNLQELIKRREALKVYQHEHSYLLN